MIIKKTSKYLIPLLLFWTYTASGQKENSNNQDFLWTRYHLTTGLFYQWKWINEVDNRVFLSSFRRNQIIAHSHVHRSLGQRSEASIGLTYSNVRSGPPFNNISTSTKEFRPFQEFYLNHVNTPNSLKIFHRIRSEERFFRSVDSPAYFNWRFRYQLAMYYDLGSKVRLKISDEIFVNAGKNIVYNTFDANRLYAAFAFKIAKPFTFETGYLRSVQQLATGKQFLKRDNIRLTLYHQIRPNS